MSGRVGGCVRWGGVALILAVGVSPFLASSEAGASNAPPGPAGAPTAPIASKGCGAHWALFPCELNKGTGKCEATNLKGNVKQRCK